MIRRPEAKYVPGRSLFDGNRQTSHEKGPGFRSRPQPRWPLMPLQDNREMHERPINRKRSTLMLESLAIILIILWLLGLVSSYTLGGLIHVLLVVAVVVILMRLIQGRRV